MKDADRGSVATGCSPASLPQPYYDRDGITIYHGDSRLLLPLIVGDVLVTDPPYEIDGTWSGGKSHGWGRHAGEAAKWDFRPEWFLPFVDRFSNAIIWGGQYFPLPPSGAWLVWDKKVRNFTGGHCELAWSNLKQPIRAFNFCNGELSSEGKMHPTQKPLSLMRWCLGFVADGIVVDPFAGAGTTLVAAKHEGRQAVGIELEERYCEIAAKRLAQGVLF